MVKFNGERLNLFIHYTVKVRHIIVNKCVTTLFEAFLLFVLLRVWSDSGHTESCFVVEFCLGKEKEKPLGAGEEPGNQWGGKITYFGPKMNHL